MISRKLYPYWFVVPAFAIFSTLYLIPTFASFYYSLTDWQIQFDRIRFVGFKQFANLFRDAREGFIPPFIHTVKFAVFVTVFQNVIGFLLALLLNRVFLGNSFFKTIIFMPVIVGSLISSYLFSSIYRPDGLLNELLAGIGLGMLQHDWLGDFGTALFSVAAVNVWQFAGFSMAVYLAAMKGVPNELLEAADIDGASYRSKIRNIIVPLIAPAFTVNIVLTLISTMKVFDYIVVMTSGGPAGETEVINTFIYRQFDTGNYGVGIAANVLLFLFIACVSFILLFLLKKREAVHQ